MRISPFIAYSSNISYGKVLLKDTMLDSTEFHSSQLKQVEFQVCSLNDMYIHDTPFKSCDISRSYFDSITLSKEDMTGCTISSSQAVTFAGLMGLNVKD